MSCSPLCRFSSNSCSYFLQYSLGSSKNPVFDGFSGFLQLGVVGEFNFFFIFRSRRVFYTMWPIFVEFMQLLSAIQPRKFEKPVFWRFWGFLQLGVVGEFNSFFIFRSEYIFYTIEPIFVEIVQELFVIQSWKSENPDFSMIFYGFWGFLQLGVVGETSNIAHVTLAVHTFAGKKEFFKSAQYFFLFRITYTHTYTHTHIARQRQILL